MSNPVGIAMIGVGRAAQRQHLPAYQKLQSEGKVKIVAVCDVHEETARAAAAEFGVPHAFTDWTEMLRMPEIDAVDVCTPNYLHKQPVVDAFAAGKHVLVEKPIAINAVEGAAMVAAAKSRRQAASSRPEPALRRRAAGDPSIYYGRQARRDLLRPRPRAAPTRHSKSGESSRKKTSRAGGR